MMISTLPDCLTIYLVSMGMSIFMGQDLVGRNYFLIPSNSPSLFMSVYELPLLLYASPYASPALYASPVDHRGFVIALFYLDNPWSLNKRKLTCPHNCLTGSQRRNQKLCT